MIPIAGWKLSGVTEAKPGCRFAGLCSTPLRANLTSVPFVNPWGDKTLAITITQAATQIPNTGVIPPRCLVHFEVLKTTPLWPSLN